MNNSDLTLQNDFTKNNLLISTCKQIKTKKHRKTDLNTGKQQQTQARIAQKLDKIFAVQGTDAIAGPGAVVVESLDTAITP